MNKIYQGDCKEIMSQWPDNCVDAIVTDPPYGLRFMGKKWDYDVPGIDVWAECLRVLKPGGHLLSFAGARTYHRMAVNIEDAGFEIRDLIAWVYGSGFPKSLSISKAIDLAAGVERAVVGNVGEMNGRNIANHKKTHEILGGVNGWDKDITAPATDAAKQWEGFGTALKPALEPVVLARKPLSEKTVAANVLKWGTGGLNIDGSRVATNESLNGGAYSNSGYERCDGWGMVSKAGPYRQPQGRFPANLIHDGSDEVVGLFPNTAKTFSNNASTGNSTIWSNGKEKSKPYNRYDMGGTSAARFFYCAKSSRSERGEGNNHPTVNPIALIKYLINLVSREGQLILDPFGGSGTTAVACVETGRNYIIIEKEPEYIKIIHDRIAKHTKQLKIF